MKLGMSATHDRPTIPVPPALRGREAPPSSPTASRVQHARWQTRQSVEDTFATLARLADRKGGRR